MKLYERLWEGTGRHEWKITKTGEENEGQRWF